MSQFSVRANADPVSRKLMPYFLVVQSDLIDTADSRVVVPLISPERATPRIDRLMPILKVAGKSVVMDTPQIAGVPMRMLGKSVADVSRERAAIMGALDMLISGI